MTKKAPTPTAAGVPSTGRLPLSPLSLERRWCQCGFGVSAYTLTAVEALMTEHAVYHLSKDGHAGA